MKNTLPNKPSELAELALHDLTLCERSKKYEIDMGMWHCPDFYDPSICMVCFAGSVMAKSLDAPFLRNIDPVGAAAHGRDARKLYALDELQRGDAATYLRRGFGINIFYAFSQKDADYLCTGLKATPYEKDKAQFKRDIRKIIRWLKKQGY